MRGATVAILTNKSKNNAAIGMPAQISATVRQSNDKPNKNTSRYPVVADTPDKDIITSRTDGSLLMSVKEQHEYCFGILRAQKPRQGYEPNFTNVCDDWRFH